MTVRLGLRLLALALPAALLVPAAAHAGTLTVDDGAGDAKALNMAVIFVEMFDGTTADGPIFLDAPAETSTDVVRTTIDHARKRLTLTVQLRDLVDTEGHSVEFRIFTPQGRYDLSAGSYGDRCVPISRPGGAAWSSSTTTARSPAERAAPCGPATTSPPTR